MSVQRLFTRTKIVDQLTGLAFGIAVAVGIAVGIDVYDAVGGATDAELLSQPFWVHVAGGAAVTAIRSALSAIGTALGLTIKGVSSA